MAKYLAQTGLSTSLSNDMTCLRYIVIKKYKCKTSYHKNFISAKYIHILFKIFVLTVGVSYVTWTCLCEFNFIEESRGH